MRSDATHRLTNASLESGGGRILEPLMDREQRRGGGGQAEEHATEHDHATGDGAGPGTGATTTTHRSTTNAVAMNSGQPQADGRQRAGELRASAHDEETGGAVGEAMRIEVRIAHQRQQHRRNADECVRRHDDDQRASRQRRHHGDEDEVHQHRQHQRCRQHRRRPRQGRAAFPAFPRRGEPDEAGHHRQSADEPAPTAGDQTGGDQPEPSDDEQRCGQFRAPGVGRERPRTVGDRPHRDRARNSDRGDAEPGGVRGRRR